MLSFERLYELQDEYLTLNVQSHLALLRTKINILTQKPNATFN